MKATIYMDNVAINCQGNDRLRHSLYTIHIVFNCQEVYELNTLEPDTCVWYINKV
jgi:hypothetical protein